MATLLVRVYFVRMWEWKMQDFQTTIGSDPMISTKISHFRYVCVLFKATLPSIQPNYQSIRQSYIVEVIRKNWYIVEVTRRADVTDTD